MLRTVRGVTALSAAILFLASVVLPLTATAETPAVVSPETAAPAAASEIEQLQVDMNFLAADTLEGRDTGSPGILEAGNYIQKVFKESGLKTPENFPEGVQTFTIPSLPELGKKNQLISHYDDKAHLWKIETDYNPCSFGGAGKFSAPVVFCGYGIIDEENHYNDFANVEVKGKIALILRRVPGQTKPGSLYVEKNSTIDTNRAALRTKLTNAKEQGAIAVLFVNDLFSTQNDKKDELLTFGYGGGSDGKEIPVLHITQKMADQLLREGLNLSLEELDQSIEETLKPASAELQNLTVSGQVDMNFEQTIGRNIVGVLEPADPETKETIIIGAHYDHVGWGKYGSLAPGTEAIHNGADDNASGTVALLSLARRLSEQSGQLPRRVVLIAFSAEERGLLGSKHYVEQPVYPLADTIAMINLDMVGRMSDEKLTVFGVGSSSVWDTWLDRIADSTQLNFFREQKAFGPSDHASFYEKKIPVLHLFTGLHEDYHRPTDDIEDINIQGILQVVNVLYDLTVHLAEASERPDFILNKEWIQVGNHAGGRAYVGISPDRSFHQAGYRVAAVAKNSPAAHAGLEAGDLITKVNGKNIESRKDFWEAVDASQPKEKLTLKIRRGEQSHEATLKLGKPR